METENKGKPVFGVVGYHCESRNLIQKYIKNSNFPLSIF
jgi:hypothetical protein